MVPTAANSPSAQPAIVKIRRVKDALIPLLFVPLLLLLLVFTRLPRYFYSLKGASADAGGTCAVLALLLLLAPPRAGRAFALPPLRVRPLYKT